MTQNNQDNQGAAGTLIFAALLTDSFIQPFGQQTQVQPARIAVLSTTLRILVLMLVMGLYLLLMRNRAQSKLSQYLLSVALLFSVALEVIQAERFYSYVMVQKLPTVFFLLLVFVAAFYGAFAGRATLSRVAWFVLVLVGCSMVLLVISVWPQLHFYNLQTPQTNAAEIAGLALQQFYLPPELLLLPQLESRKTTPKTSRRVLFGLLLIDCALSVLGELTLGTAYTLQNLPVFTIARLGGISVFRRLDAVHVSIWLLLFLIKIALYFVVVVRIWRKHIPTQNRHTPYWVAIACVVVLFMLFGSDQANIAFWVQQGLLALAMVLTLLLGGRKQNEKA